MSNNLQISIITPSFNQGQYIVDTIESVLDQNYNNIEHIIIDGGSNDRTVDILKRYPHLKWISEKDTGQSNAINKGFKMCTGEIIAWINSDDYYESNIMKDVADYFLNNPSCYFLYGNITYVNERKQFLYMIHGDIIRYENLLKDPDIVRQPSSFWRKDVLKELGLLNEKLHLVMDYDFILRICKKHKPHYLNKNLSYYRHYSNTKTSRHLRIQVKELHYVIKKHKRFNIQTYKLLLGKYIDSLEDNSIMKKILNNFRKKRI